MDWPVYDTEPNYNVTLQGLNLLCDDYHTLVYMKIGPLWGDPSFLGHMTMCRVIAERISSVSCTFSCKPAPEYSEAVFVYMRNFKDYVTSICEVSYEEK